jgi:hypothetical protein
MQDDLDRLIDNALAGYSSAEPLAGLEQRVLRRVRTVRRRRWWGLVLIPAAAVLVLALLPARHVDVAMAPPPRFVEPEPIGDATVMERSPQARRRPRRIQPNRNREYFPTPTPLTPEERVLVELARTKPEQLPPPPAQELEIKPIEIAPLVPDGRQ